MCMPALSTFSSGFPIPLKVDISCPQSPALPKMLCPFLEVQLLRRLLAVVDGKMVLGSRDIVVCSGSLIETVTPQEGTTVSHFEVMVGQPGHEQTWQVKDIIDVSVRLYPSFSIQYEAILITYLSMYSRRTVYSLSIDKTVREHEISSAISSRRGHSRRE